MSDPYERVKGGRLMFKGGAVATRSKSIDKKKKKKKNKSINDVVSDEPLTGDAAVAATEQQGEASEDIYTIDAAKRRKYDDLFPVEAKKFGYDPNAKAKSVEDALDDRVKKKADRYCK
ncbi:hypothetical protein BC332_08626 [Capsicum chinense]|uniref:Uncharacterized protein n=1 Tax=Capsicum annuum TaxID=4072 RepID=A0A1U8G7I3_CAPAN|nr:uncharacterized protein LOC107862824 [Capsicum annuum]XP_047265552.1 uncharacterized protein LOC107862824 [Capsicum annuum]PHU23519.1 hypothetical protein BC332_08626 [Capsicum chinense]KAF3667510.1 putative tubby-like F-box protein 8-like isoform X1 [Capsicum annuum]KAF3671521.1 putative tubby-like F-box protein 8-like isoform X1 [Capsicum annuum]PHT61294.1 hypothetical protein T459_34850 [Capsicum annuum]